jgi:hypothetical protein
MAKFKKRASIMPHPGGRPLKFKSVEELQEAFVRWKLTFDKGDTRELEIPDVEGFCDYIDAYRDLFSEYEKKPEFSDTIKRIKNWIYYKKKQLAMNNKMNAAIYIFDAKNNAGYVDKTEIDARVEEVKPILGGLTKDEQEE